MKIANTLTILSEPDDEEEPLDLLFGIYSNIWFIIPPLKTISFKIITYTFFIVNTIF